MFSATKGGSTAGYQISRSVRLRSSASAFFNRTPASATNQQKFTWSGWVKRGTLGSSVALFSAPNGSSDTTWFDLLFDANNKLNVSGFSTFWRITTQVFRDPSAWYHIVLAVDTTQATANNRILLYVNGTQITAFDTTNNMAQNANTGINAAAVHYVGRSSASYFDGYLTEVNFIDGQALTPSSFGETNPYTGVWQAKRYTGTYGTNGFYLNFSDNSAATAAAIGKDYSGLGNNWTPNNISVTAGVTYDSMLDVPTQWGDGGNGRGNYCTLLPTAAGSYVTMSNGNLTVTGNTPTNSGVTLSSIAVTSGLFYFENTITTVGGISYIGFARMNSGYSDLNNAESFTNTNNYGGVYRNSGDVFGFGRTISSTSTFTTGDVLGLALDMDNGAAYISKNGTWLNSGVPTSGASKTGALFTWTAGTQTICPMGGGYNGSVNNFNFGQRPFSYTPPSGFKALNTLNLPTPTILKGNQYMNVLTWSGTGGSAGATRSLTGLGFQPDFVWEKDRASAQDHHLFDSVRGAGTNKTLASNSTGAEGGFNDTLYGYLSSFDADGFTTTNGSSTWDNWNKSGDSYVAWSWKEGATQGFDIVTYTGTGSSTTIAHNLGVAPAMIIAKNRSAAADWYVAFAPLAGWTWSSDYLLLNGTGAKQTNGGGTVFPVAPTSSVFTVGGAATNASGNNFVAYLFAEVAGFSKFGSYTGNGSADGPFVFCGFRPRWIMFKRTDVAEGWQILDTARNTVNVVNSFLEANQSNAEGTSTARDTDYTANGFKVRNTSAAMNASGGTYIFAAFSEVGFKYALGR